MLAPVSREGQGKPSAYLQCRLRVDFRHPHYIGFIIMSGFLLQRPTFLMFPALVFMSIHLAHTEEFEAPLNFGDVYVWHAARVLGWFPHPRIRGT